MIAVSKIWQWTLKLVVVLLGFFQIIIISVFVTPIIFIQSHHTGFSEVYTYDEIGSSDWESNGADRLSRVLPAGLVRPDYEVLANVTSVAVKTGTTALTKFYSANDGFLGATDRTFLMPGQQISRFGSNSGKFFSPAGTPLPMRALPQELTLVFIILLKYLNLLKFKQVKLPQLLVNLV